ncbi:MAG: trans-sulfuration enzyme family protein [Candidatus Dormibacteria bacterium]
MSDAERRLGAIRAGGQPGESPEGADLAASPSLGSARAYTDLDALDAAMEADPRHYRRHGNDTVALLESTLAMLERPDGAPPPVARACASGQAALQLAVTTAAMSGRRHVVLLRPCYGGTESLLAGPLAALGLRSTVVDLPPPPQEADAAALLAAVLDASVAMVVVEAVTNPLLQVVDVTAVAAAAHAAGALLLVDNTLPTPFLLQPLAHGADLVHHSLTKHLSGHSDVLGGALLAAADSEPAAWMDAHQRALGGVLSPFDAWLTLRGIRTAPLRVDRGAATATQLALRLQEHPAVVAVHHPAVRQGSQATLAARLLPRGAAPMLTLDVAGGLAGASRVVRALRGIRLAPSLGDVSTTVSHPASTSHRTLSPQARASLGVGDGLLRFSLGVEDADVLLEELSTALSAP